MTNPSGYRNCMNVLYQSLEFIFQQNQFNELNNEQRIEIIEKNWLWVMIIELAMTHLEINFGEMEIESQNENISTLPTKECAQILANSLNRYT